ncbi:HEAT repeat domain-containing protein [Candidatus Micrarchaeota archaeon]|nr:HEAT repeat domain-containing protein [Candidatus Micrarchaeota archaeon]
MTKDETFELLEILKSTGQSDENRIDAIRQLGNMKEIMAVEPLIRIVSNSYNSPLVRIVAASALGSIGHKGAVEPLIKVLEQNEKDNEVFSWSINDVRVSIVFALGDLGGDRAISSLTKTLDDEIGQVRWAAASALGKTKSPRAVDSLLRKFKDPVFDNDDAIASALGVLEDEKAVEPLLQYLNDEKNKNRRTLETVALALTKISDKYDEKIATAIIAAASRVNSNYLMEIYVDYQKNKTSIKSNMYDEAEKGISHMPSEQRKWATNKLTELRKKEQLTTLIPIKKQDETENEKIRI